MVVAVVVAEVVVVVVTAPTRSQSEKPQQDQIIHIPGPRANGKQGLRQQRVGEHTG